MPRRRRAPSRPEIIAQRRAAEKAAARNPESWGVDTASLALPANADVVMRPRTAGRGVSANRRDVFDRLLAGDRSEVLAAVRRLQADVSARQAAPGGVGRYAERVDAGPADQSCLESRLRVGERLRRVLALTGVANARLLAAIVEPEAVLGRQADWRLVVMRETGERLPDAQAGVLRAACRNLAEAYALLDRGRRA